MNNWGLCTYYTCIPPWFRSAVHNAIGCFLMYEWYNICQHKMWLKLVEIVVPASCNYQQFRTVHRNLSLQSMAAVITSHQDDCTTAEFILAEEIKKPEWFNWTWATWNKLALDRMTYMMWLAIFMGCLPRKCPTDHHFSWGWEMID